MALELVQALRAAVGPLAVLAVAQLILQLLPPSPTLVQAHLLWGGTLWWWWPAARRAGALLPPAADRSMLVRGALGVAAGVALFAAPLPVAWPWLRCAPGDGAGLIALALALPALGEEALWRGVLLPRTAALRRPLALGVQAAVFAAAHAANPGVGAAALVGVFLAGLGLGVARLWGGLAAAAGMHWAWNVSIASLGLPLSGHRFDSIARCDLSRGPAGLLGGDFGPESGFLWHLAWAGAALAVYPWTRRQTHTSGAARGTSAQTSAPGAGGEA